MKRRCPTIRAGLTIAVLIAMIMLQVVFTSGGTFAATSTSGAEGASPTGELRLAMSGIGFMRPVPWQETTFGKGYMTLLYDFLVGANPDGSLSTANGAAERWELSPDGLTWTFW